MDSPAAGSPRTRRRARVLLVDSASLEGGLFSAHLRGAGFDVQVVADGFEALARAVARRPDAIVMDTGGSRLDAFDLPRRLKAAAATRDIPVIPMVARGRDAFDPKELEAEVERQLGGHRPRPRRRGRAGRN
jgi:chemosensory pili system protein ChpA (sensor histidine kinase/response regulator)